MWHATGEERGLQAHRGSFKSTSVLVVGSVWWLLLHPNDRIAIVRKTFSDSAKVVNAIAKLFELPEIVALFTAVHGFAPKMTTRRNGELTFNFKRTITAEGSITSHGLDGSLTGTHYDKILCDDVITLKDRVSRAEREFTKEMMREISTNIIDAGQGVSWLGTPWAVDDGWSILQCPVVKFPLADCNLLSEEEIEKKRRTTTPFLFDANYNLVLKSDNNMLFNDPTYGKWIQPPYGAYAHLDAAFDGNHTCALTIMSDRPGDKGVKQALGFSYSGNVKDWVHQIAAYCKRYRVKALYNETNPDKGYTADKLRALGVNVRTYAERQNKHIKISTYLYNEWRSILWDDSTEPEYMVQVTDYRDGQEPDDAPDSAASLIREVYSGAAAIEALYRR